MIVSRAVYRMNMIIKEVKQKGRPKQRDISMFFMNISCLIISVLFLLLFYFCLQSKQSC